MRKNECYLSVHKPDMDVNMRFENFKISGFSSNPSLTYYSFNASMQLILVFSA